MQRKHVSYMKETQSILDIQSRERQHSSMETENCQQGDDK